MQITTGPDAGNFYPSENAVKLFPINTVLPQAPVAVTIGGILLADATDVNKSLHGLVTVQNLGPNTIFITFGLSATVIPAGFTTLTGLSILTLLSYTLDLWGGMAIWGITTALQVAPADTRVIGGKRT